MHAHVFAIESNPCVNHTIYSETYPSVLGTDSSSEYKTLDQIVSKLRSTETSLSNETFCGAGYSPGVEEQASGWGVATATGPKRVTVLNDLVDRVGVEIGPRRSR